ncbi:MAG: hypothetical protein Q7S40_18185 [Opitutaceae bacterium]|nr:hypothetical protein [Opitutaceae bacterium]
MKNRAILLLFSFSFLLPARVAAGSVVLDEGRYRDDAEAQAAWRPMKGTAPAAAANVQGRAAVRLPCNFAGTTFERASWDRTVNADLATCRGIQFEFFCPNPSPVSQFSIYFQSGGGWYSTTFQPEATNAWCTVVINKHATRIEGEPAGWNRISTIRVSAWRGQGTDTEICLRNFRPAGVLGIDASVAILRAESVARGSPAEARSVDQFTENVAAGFESFGIGCATPGDLDVTVNYGVAESRELLPLLGAGVTAK